MPIFLTTEHVLILLKCVNLETGVFHGEYSSVTRDFAPLTQEDQLNISVNAMMKAIH